MIVHPHASHPYILIPANRSKSPSPQESAPAFQGRDELSTYTDQITNWRDLGDAIKKSDSKAAQRLLKKGIPLTVPDYAGRTLLHHFVYQNDQAAARFYVQKLGGKPNHPDPQGDTPLHLAATLGRNSMIRFLTDELGADPKARNYQGKTLLHLAARANQPDILKLLVHRYGLDPNAQDKIGNTPLHLALHYRQAEAARTLVADLGASVDIQGCQGKTARDEAKVEGTRFQELLAQAESDRESFKPKPEPNSSPSLVKQPNRKRGAKNQDSPPAKRTKNLSLKELMDA